MKNIDTSKVAEKVIKLNDQLNARCDRAVNVRHALGVKGSNLLNELFKETDNFINDRPEKMIKSIQAFLKFLASNPAKAASYLGCITAQSKTIMQQITKATSVQEA